MGLNLTKDALQRDLPKQCELLYQEDQTMCWKEDYRMKEKVFDEIVRSVLVH